MKQLILGFIFFFSFVGCNEYNTYTQSASDVLESLSSSLDQEDQQSIEDIITEVGDIDLLVTEDTLNPNNFALEIEEQALNVEILTEEGISLRVNGVELSLDELSQKEIMETLFEAIALSSQETEKLTQVSGSSLSGLFGPLARMVVTGLVNSFLGGSGFGSILAPIIQPILNPVLDNFLGDSSEDQESGSQEPDSEDSPIGSLFTGLLGNFLGSLFD